MSIPDCTLTSACFCFHSKHSGARPLHEIIEQLDALLRMPVYLVIYGDKETIPLMKEQRKNHSLDSLTRFVEIKYLDLPAFRYLEKVKQNRSIYHPTKDARTNAETHLITCSKFYFVLKTIEENPFHTSKFGWIDSFLGKNASKICENYDETMMPWTLSHITEKFHIQVLNVCDKKYKLTENKQDYYSQYRWVVCGCLFTCGEEIGRRILTRLNQIFIDTTLLGYGHGEEMFYLEVLDEFSDDIVKAYGDYGQIVNNFIYPQKNYHYIYYFILKNYVRLEYWREAYDCSKSLLESIENHTLCYSPEIFVGIAIDHYISAFHFIPDKCQEIYSKITTTYSKNPLFKIEFEKEQRF
uniref:Uncharacterized protein n=1 Tax=viral metagenome TaxID=1070528 RepID=A0A6C0JH46_9ZZZZ